jgi:hypothetical protein
MPTGAIVGSMIVGAGASVYSGNKAADAAKKGSQQSADIQRYMYDTSRSDTAPYREVGVSALNQLAKLYGIQSSASGGQTKPMSLEEFTASDLYKKPDPGAMVQSQLSNGRGLSRTGMMGVTSAPPGVATPDAQYQQYVNNFQPQAVPAANDGAQAAPDYSAFMNSPDYQFAYGEGSRAVEQGLARQGLTGSGAALKALTRVGQGLASQQLGNYKNSLASLAGIGQTSTSQLSSLGAATGQGMGQSMQNAGDARASSYLNSGAAVSGIANSGSQLALMKAGGYFNSPPPSMGQGSYLNWNQGIA